MSELLGSLSGYSGGTTAAIKSPPAKPPNPPPPLEDADLGGRGQRVPSLPYSCISYNPHHYSSSIDLLLLPGATHDTRPPGCGHLLGRQIRRLVVCLVCVVDSGSVLCTT